MNRLPRIAFVANNWYVPWGGSEELWSLAALHLKRSGVPVMACVQNWRPTPARIVELERAGVEVRVVRPPRAMRLREGLRAKWRGGQRRSLQRMTVEDAIRPFEPDLVVVSQMQNLDGHAWAAALHSCAIPYALLSQAASEFAWPVDAELQAAQAAHARAKASFFVCRENRELTERQLAIRIPAAELVSNPFAVSHEQPEAWPGDDVPPSIACVARLELAAKGQDLLFEALSAAKWRERGLRLSLFGSGVNDALVRALAGYFDLPAATFHGHTSDVAGIWRTHHALVLPSRCEGTPLALMEAMLCHRPAIVTDVGGNADLVEDGVSGFVARSVTAEGIDEALERAWQRRTEWRQMGIAAGRRVRRLVPADPPAAFADRLRTIALAR